MKLRGLFPLLLAAGGCAGILGIPSDVERSAEDAGLDTGTDGPTQPDTSTLDVIDGGADVIATDADAGPTLPGCDLLKEFDPPVLIEGDVNTAEQEGSPRLSDDELTLYFSAIRAAVDGPTSNIYVATRPAYGMPFGNVTKVPGEVNTTDNDEYAPNITPDGKTIFFERQSLAPPYDNDFWTASRSAVGQPFTGAAPLAGFNTGAYEGKLFVPESANEVYFARQLGAQADIFFAKIVNGVYVSNKIEEIASPQNDYQAVVSRDGLVMYFSSARPVNGAGNDLNIYRSTRATKTDPWGAPLPVTPLNMPGKIDEPSWLSRDGCRLYMYSDRAGAGPGSQDLYVAILPK